MQECVADSLHQVGSSRAIGPSHHRRDDTWQGKCKANTETVMLLYLFTILGGTSPSMTNVFIVCSCRTQYCLHWSGSNKLRGRAFNQVPNILKSDHGSGLLLYLRMNIYFAIEISAKLNDRGRLGIYLFSRSTSFPCVGWGWIHIKSQLN